MSDENLKNLVLTSSKVNALEKTLVDDSNKTQYRANRKKELQKIISTIESLPDADHLSGLKSYLQSCFPDLDQK